MGKITVPIYLYLAVIISAIISQISVLPAHAQTNLRAHYADGQVWVVWDFTDPAPETFVIYSSDSPITSISGASIVGRPFRFEYISGALRTMFADPDLNWVIPSFSEVGVDTLAADEALFVGTVHAAGPRYFAVVAHGDTVVTPGVNATTTAIHTLFQPGEEVTCHPQMVYSSKPGFSTEVHAMWADGRPDPEDGRPDFPVMANPAKNGMPSVFFVSYRDDIAAGPQPVAYWLHGGGGTAKQSVPGSRQIYNIDPESGYLVAHNDDLVRYVESAENVVEEHSSSWWFGWNIGHDPFPGGPEFPEPDEIVINYTQRRLLWIHRWLVDEGRVDPERTSIFGHSLGSAGSTALAKAFPNIIATCTIFNNGMTGPAEDIGSDILGRVEDELKCNLVDANGDSVTVRSVFDLSTNISPTPDLPLFRVFHGKNDDNGTMMWDATVVSEYVRADSLGLGMHLYWDERDHSAAPPPVAHWCESEAVFDQTRRDNVEFQEHFLVHQSFPAFYNHRLQPDAFDPGDGTRGTHGNGVGDDWGTWGGYHAWDTATLLDTPDRWEATISLVGSSSWTVDNAVVDNLTSDLMIRKPQQFLPSAGEAIVWIQTNVQSGDTLHHGLIAADAEGRVRLQNLTTYKDPLQTRIQFRRGSVTGTRDLPTAGTTLDVWPNPFNPRTTISFTLEGESTARLTVHDLRGRLVRTIHDGPVAGGRQEFNWDGLDNQGQALASGLYFVKLASEGDQQVKKALLVR